MEDYSIIQDLLETWRSTSDWVKVVVITAIPGQVIFLIYQVLRHRAEQREDVIIDARVRSLARAEMCRLAAEWERARKVKGVAPPALPGDRSR